jgi:hypothetical protein
MSAAEILNDLLDDLITLKVFTQLTGITNKAVYGKIHKNTWTEGKEYIKDPEGRIWISRSGYQQWIRSGFTPTQEALNQERTQYKSTSASKVKLTTVTKHSHGLPPKLI